MRDLVQRLRDEATALQRAAWSRTDGGQDHSLAAAIADEAADEIERLRGVPESAGTVVSNLMEMAKWIDLNVPQTTAVPLREAAAEIQRLLEALRLFQGAAYPVAEAINPRGHNWCEAYLDQALTHAGTL